MSMSKMDKIPTDQNNMEDLLTWIPEEMWLKIFTFVEQKDLRSISMSSPLFAGCLYNEKVKFLFYYAVPILTSYLDLTEILKCREVCKAWQTAVDSCFENATRPLCEENIRSKSRIEEIELFCYPLQEFDKRRMEELEKVAVAHPRNPIVGRHFDVTTSEEVQIFGGFRNARVDEQLYAPLERCLQQFGGHIWHLNVCDNSKSRMSLLEYFTQLRKFLLLCPNLKSFGFTVCCIYEMNNDGQLQLTNFMNANALPNMHSLQMIKTGTNENLGLQNKRIARAGMAKIQDILMVRYSTQLQSLDLHWLQWKPSYCNGDALENLKELRLREINSNQSVTALTQRMSSTNTNEFKLPSLMGLDLGLEFEFDEIDVEGALMQLVRTVKQASDLRRVGLAISFIYSNHENDWDYEGLVIRYFSEEKYFLWERKDENLNKLEENITSWVENLELEEDSDSDCYNSDDDVGH